MKTANWDPLENLTSELVNTTIRRQIKNILKSYTGWFDPFSELIQNALDALDARKEENAQFTPKLWIQIDLEKNMLSVTDNGIGFSEDKFRNFLAPNVSFKGQENRGNKGVGATYLAYGFNFLQVGTKTPDYEFIGTLPDGRKWVEDEEDTELRPTVKPENEALHSVFHEIDHGTTFTLKFIGKSIRPQKLDWLNANTAKQWSAILRIKTPLGGIYLCDADPPEIQCALTVTDKNGQETTEHLTDCEYLFPHKVFPSCADVDEIIFAQDTLSRRRRNRSKLPQKYSNLYGVYKYWNTDSFISKEDEFGKRFRLNDEQKQLVTEYNLRCYGFFCYTTRLWDIYNDSNIKIRKGERILKGGLQLATNTMPQGELILIPLTSNIGYQHTTHVVVHLDHADPDLGRKGFQPEIEELAEFVSTQVVNYFLDWREHLQTDTGAPLNIVEDREIYDWVNQLAVHEKRNPLIIEREDVFLPLMEPSITAEPLNEQDVISLFNQLLAGGVIRGVRLMATSQHNQYDSVFRYSLREPFKNYVFDKEENPLGVQDVGLQNSEVAKRYESSPKILEYKYSFDALIEEIEKEIKNEEAIELVVAWTFGKNWHTRYDVIPLLHYDYLHHRRFHGFTHLIKNRTGNIVFRAIILSELIAYLNDPDSVQEYQAATYEV